MRLVIPTVTLRGIPLAAHVLFLVLVLGLGSQRAVQALSQNNHEVVGHVATKRLEQ